MADIAEINIILEEIFALESPKINAGKKDEVREFLRITINGDTIKSHLVISANLGNGKSGALVYILTDSRLITVSVTDAGDAESLSYKLDTMVGISRKLDEGRMQIRITFQGDKNVGLRYPITSTHITNFFQNIDHEKVKEPPHE